jgi:predicted DNA-binding transcriptional regulator AlpA
MQQRAFPEKKAAEYIGYSVWFLRECRTGRLGPGPAHIKINRTVRYLREDLDAWLDSFKQQDGAA